MSTSVFINEQGFSGDEYYLVGVAYGSGNNWSDDSSTLKRFRPFGNQEQLAEARKYALELSAKYKCKIHDPFPGRKAG